VRFGAVRVDGKTVGQIDQGLVTLVGVTHGDTPAEAEKLARKTAHLRIFEDAEGKMNRSVLDIGGGVLVVSQFTLYADCRRGRRPSFVRAAPPDVAASLIDHYAEALRHVGVTQVESGVFGAHMEVEIHNDGPVTIVLDTEEL